MLLDEKNWNFNLYQSRPSGTDVVVYAEKVVGQVEQLLAAGVPPGHITVIGFSKGGMIAVYACSKLARKDVNFVFMACCSPWPTV